MAGVYEMEMKYHPKKEAMEEASIGLAITFGCCLFGTGIGAAMFFLSRHMPLSRPSFSSSSSSSSSVHNDPLFTDKEAEMESPEYRGEEDGTTPDDNKVSQPTGDICVTPGDSKVSQPTGDATPSGEPSAEPNAEPSAEPNAEPSAEPITISSE